jgi:hypothetical protein
MATQIAQKQSVPKIIELDGDESKIILDGVALTALRNADLEQQSTAALARPRELLRFREDLQSMATVDQETAASCYYSLPRGGKAIEGPSVRFAEMVAHAWTNLATQTTIMSIDDSAVIVRARVVDLERNSITEMENRRIVHKKRNKPRPDDDDKQIAVAVATSISYRNAVFRAVPRALWEPIYQKTLRAADGEGTMEHRRQRAVNHFKELGATESQILAAIGREGVEEISASDLRHLMGMATAIKEGTLTLADAMRGPEAEKPRGPAKAGGQSPLAAKMASKKQAANHDPETGEVYEDGHETTIIE